MLFEMINQEFKAQGRNYQMLHSFWVFCKELWGLKVFAHVCIISALSPGELRDNPYSKDHYSLDI